jgi:hypothetical protein
MDNNAPFVYVSIIRLVRSLASSKSSSPAANSHHPHRRGKPVLEFSDNLASDRKIKDAVGSLYPPSAQWSLLEFSDEDKELIADFILDWSNFGNGRPMTPNTKKAYINTLNLLSRHVKDVRNGGVYKPFREMTRDDFLAQEKPKGYLRSLKPDSAEVEDEKWVNTHNTLGAVILAFWKWLTQRDFLESSGRHLLSLKVIELQSVIQRQASKDNIIGLTRSIEFF